MILVLGDIFIDNYFLGTIRGMSAEAPIPIVDVVSTKICYGGAWNVLSNLVALDANAQYKYSTYDNNDRNVPIKNRLLVDNQQLARWDERDWCYPYPPDLALDPTQLEAIIVSDYSKGSITPEVIQYLLSLDLPLYVDTKSDPIPYLGGKQVTLFPNLSEYRKYQASYDWFPRVLLKKSEEGLAWLEYGRVSVSRPALAQKVVSVNGAGDTVLAAWVYAQTQGMDLVSAMEFANAAAAVVVEKPFTATATLEEISARSPFSVGA